MENCIHPQNNWVRDGQAVKCNDCGKLLVENVYAEPPKIQRTWQATWGSSAGSICVLGES